MNFKGRAWVFGDNVSGDDGIIQFSVVRSGAHVFDEDELKSLAFARIRPEFRSEVKEGDIVVGGKAFAVPNHPQVSAALRASGISVVLAESTDTSFIRKSLNIGLPVIVVDRATSEISDGDIIHVDLDKGIVRNDATGVELIAEPYSETMLRILRAGGLVPFLKMDSV